MIFNNQQPPPSFTQQQKRLNAGIPIGVTGLGGHDLDHNNRRRPNNQSTGTVIKKPTQGTTTTVGQHQEALSAAEK